MSRIMDVWNNPAFKLPYLYILIHTLAFKSISRFVLLLIYVHLDLVYSHCVEIFTIITQLVEVLLSLNAFLNLIF